MSVADLTKEELLFLAKQARDYPPGWGYEWGLVEEINSDTYDDRQIEFYLANPESG